MLAQPKANGSNVNIFMDDSTIHIMNRHKQPITNCKLNLDELHQLYNGEGWMVINGEYMNKSKRDENGKVFNDKLIIFDILVNKSDYLIGKTFQERVQLLNETFKSVDYNPWLNQISDNIFIVKTFYNGFNELYHNLVMVDMWEGIVCKRKNAGLEMGLTETNNHKSQVKFRKPTKNYKY
jgi:ATP-dependent DNA ligase